MIKKIWEECHGATNYKRISLTSFRVQVNDQLALRSIVDNVAEENMLEYLLENSFISIPKSLLRIKFSSVNYYGSRFGHRDEPAIWYGSENKLVAFTEKAFYNLAYLFDNENINSIHGQEILFFSANIDTHKGIRLDQKPFSQYENLISSPISYENSRLLGTAMRDSLVNVFTYVSARIYSEIKGINIGVFSLDAFPNQSENKDSYEFWKCFSNKTDIEFYNQNPMSNEKITFNINDFCIDGKFPKLIS